MLDAKLHFLITYTLINDIKVESNLIQTFYNL